MNPNELTQTQRVERNAELVESSSFDEKWEMDVVEKSFALDLAAELERVKQDLKAMTEMRDTYADGFSTQSRLHGKFAREAELLEKERDDLKRQVEELKWQLDTEVRCGELCHDGALTEIHQLRDENTMLKAQNDSLDRELTRRDNENAKLRASYQDALSEIATLKYLDDEAKVGADEVSRQLDQLRADKERMDWLDANYFSMWTSEDCDDDGNDIEMVCLDVGNTDRNWITENSARQAIDQAMKGAE